MSDPSPPTVIRLDQFLKLQSWVGSGGQAKFVVQEGMVRVNGETELRRGKQLAPGDVVEFEGHRATFES